MKILLVDPISFIGHVNYNFGIFRALSLKNECYLITNEEMQYMLMDKGIPKEKFLATYSNNFSISNLAKKHKSKILYHLLYRKYLLQIYELINSFSLEFEATIFTSVEIFSFALFSRCLKGNYIVIDHDVGKIKTSWLYRCAFNIVCKHVKIIVFEDYIKDMVKNKIKNCLIYTVKHPLPKWDFEILTSKESDGIIRVFCPSASNDKRFINLLENTDIPKGIEVTVKIDKIKSTLKPGLRVYNERLTERQYVSNIMDSHFVLLPYGSEYNYRCSGVLFEAIKLNKKVLLPDYNTLSCYANIFPNQVFVFSTMEEMFKLVKIYGEKKTMPSNLTEYEDNNIHNALLLCINGR